MAKAKRPAAREDDSSAAPPAASLTSKRTKAKPATAAAGAAGPKEELSGKTSSSTKPQPEFVSHPHYLMKSEPEEFSLEDLAGKPGQKSQWDGVRNIVAMRHMRGMKLGTQIFFYHSSCKVPGIMGIAEVCREAYPDFTAFDKTSKYFDAKSNEDSPKWHMVDVKLVRALARQVTLTELRSHGESGGPLAAMALLRTARLSVQPVTQEEWDFIVGLEGSPVPAVAVATGAKKGAMGKGKAVAEVATGAGRNKSKGAGKGKESEEEADGTE